LWVSPWELDWPWHKRKSAAQPPIMWASGTGSDVMKRIAAPMVGGIFTSFLLELVVYPVVYEVWKWHFELRPREVKPEAEPAHGLLG